MVVEPGLEALHVGLSPGIKEMREESSHHILIASVWDLLCEKNVVVPQEVLDTPLR